MSAWFYRRGGSLVPEDPDTLRKLKESEAVQVTIVRPRNLAWFRKYWAICRAIGENQDPARDEDSIDAELRILAGHFDVLYLNGHEVRVPKRLAFAKLSEQKWEGLWPSFEQAISERFGGEYLEEFK